MLKRFVTVAVLTVLAGLLAAQAGTAAPQTENTFWVNKHFMNMAHQGGETEAPGNTLYAFKTAAARGADVIEMDGYLTEDGEFVITHDMEPHKTSNAPYSRFDNGGSHTNPGQFVTNQTLAELRAFDFAYKFKPGTGHYGYPHQNPENEGPASDYIYRGIATGDKPAPEGFSAADFQIATLEQVLDALPNMPMSVDMKAPRGDTTIATAAAEEVARIMNAHPDRANDVLIVSFFQEALDEFHRLAPNHKALGGTESGILSYVQGNPISPTPVAVQPPDRYNLGNNANPNWVETVPLLKQKTTADNYAIQVWPANDSVDGPTTWQKVMDQGANGFFTDKPSQLHQYLCDNKIPRPDGSPRCAGQVCPVGETGIAPNCQKPPPTTCEEIGKVGKYPNCTEVIVDPMTVLTSVKISPNKGQIKAGKKLRLKVSVTADMGLAPDRFRINLSSSNKRVKLPKSVVVKVRGGKGSATVTLKAARKAKGKAVITARNGKLSARSAVKVKRCGKVCGKTDHF